MVVCVCISSACVELLIGSARGGGEGIFMGDRRVKTVIDLLKVLVRIPPTSFSTGLQPQVFNQNLRFTGIPSNVSL